MSTKPRITLLVGAGASIDAGIPGVARLTSDLDQAVRTDDWIVHQKGDAALDAIIERLTALLEDPGEVHFERIYHVANRLMQHARDPLKAIPEYRPLLQPFFSSLPAACSETALRALERGYLRHIFRIMTDASIRADVTALREFIATLRAAFTLRIYTLNYDNLIYRAHPDLFTGFAGAPVDGRRPSRRFDRVAFFDQRDADALFHLHGSVHLSYLTSSHGDFAELFWFDDPAEALKSADYGGSGRGQSDGTFIERSPLITGYEKSTSVLAIPYSFYYSEFLRDLMASEAVLLIGYGLGDPHINELLAACRGSARPPKLFAIDFFEWLDVMHLPSLKVGRHTHVLRAPIGDDLAMQGIKGTPWRISKPLRSAVYAGGFSRLMRETANAAELIRDLV